MLLTGCKVENFRSITSSQYIPLDRLTVLIGPNNEGKSNLLLGIVRALQILLRADPSYRYSDAFAFDLRANSQIFNVTRDMPVGLDEKTRVRLRALFELEFELNEAERQEFKASTGRACRHKLRARIIVDQWSARVALSIQNIRTPFSSHEHRAALRFLQDRLDVEYISTRRSADATEQLIENLLNLELERLKSDQAYAAALKALEERESAAISQLAERLSTTIAKFLPDVTRIDIKRAAGIAYARSNWRIEVDDGAVTVLSQKGDGMQSLAALAIARHLKTAAAGSKTLILAVEEPETHLHHDAVHKLREVLHEISKANQVLMTTHSPILVDREQSRRNILVKDSTAVPAASIAAIREAIGVRISDNLATASTIVLVEGMTDRTILESWLRNRGGTVSAAIVDGRIMVEPIEGAANLTYRVQMHRALLCRVNLFLDNDNEANQAIDRAKAAGAISDREVRQSTVPGMRESEFEDLVNPDVYEAALDAAFNVRSSAARSLMGKWSARMSTAFSQQGRNWGRDKARAKHIVASEAIRDIKRAIPPQREGPLAALAAALESDL